MLATKTSLSLPRRRDLLRAFTMLAGTGFLFWRTRGIWSLSLILVAGLFVILVLFLPAVYAPMGRGLDWLERRTVEIFSWFVLGLVFALIFIPGRVVLSSAHWRRMTRSKKLHTYWEEYKSPASPEAFERQF